jgi:hypothetical protein
VNVYIWNEETSHSICNEHCDRFIRNATIYGKDIHATVTYEVKCKDDTKIKKLKFIHKFGNDVLYGILENIIRGLL